MAVDLEEPLEINLMPLGLEVQGLPAAHAAVAGGLAELLEHSDFVRKELLRHRMAREDLKAKGLQGVAREYAQSLAEGLVDGGLPAAEDIVVHRGEVIVDKGVGVDALDGGRRPLENLLVSPEELSRNEDQERAHALPSEEEPVAHGGLQLRLDRVREVIDMAFKERVDAPAVFLHVLFKAHLLLLYAPWNSAL